MELADFEKRMADAAADAHARAILRPGSETWRRQRFGKRRVPGELHAADPRLRRGRPTVAAEWDSDPDPTAPLGMGSRLRRRAADLGYDAEEAAALMSDGCGCSHGARCAWCQGPDEAVRVTHLFARKNGLRGMERAAADPHALQGFYTAERQARQGRTAARSAGWFTGYTRGPDGAPLSLEESERARGISYDR